jgi:hypothetical protein
LMMVNHQFKVKIGHSFFSADPTDTIQFLA